MLNHLNSGRPPISKDKLKKGFKQYQDALKYYWSSRPITALEHLSKIISDNVDHPYLFNLYRLWIEILLDQKDFGSLYSLSDHLLIRAKYQNKYMDNYMSFWGLIHLELDKLDAAKLIIRSLKNNSPYTAELSYLFKQRTSLTPIKSGLLTYISSLDDYFVLKTLLINYFHQSDQKNVNRIINRIKRYFPNSPDIFNYKLHVSLQNKTFYKAQNNADALLKKFPSNINYNIYSAYLAMHNKNYNRSIKILEKAINIGAEDDIDVNLLLGTSYLKLYKNELNEKYKKRSEQYLTKASELLEKGGYSAVTANYFNQILTKAQSDENKQIDQNKEAPKLWMIKLDATNFNELRTSPLNEIKYIYKPLGSSPKPDDLCFFVSDHYADKTSWRIGAIYKVVSDAKWHPVNEYESMLEIISRPETSILIDVEFSDQDNTIEKSQLQKGHPFRYGVFELNYEALDNIIDAVKEYSQTDKKSADILKVFNKLVS